MCHISFCVSIKKIILANSQLFQYLGSEFDGPKLKGTAIVHFQKFREAGSVHAANDALHTETFAALKAIRMAERLGFGRIIVAECGLPNATKGPHFVRV
jgi:hypothetical protein